MLTSAELETLRHAIPADPDLKGLLQTLRRRSAPVIAALPPIPGVKALLSRNGGICPKDGTALRFDPWSPERHTCPRCGESFTGERHHRHWARAQHLWLAERTAELALVAAVADDQQAAGRAIELIETYESLYFVLPNSDNVLGPSHLFFSTYLESLWITSYLAGAFLLREAGLLPDQRAEGVNRVADEAANLIGEFNEGPSNRQTWHAAALTAIARWFDDSELAATAIESRTGLLGHLTDGFGDDGLWWEGENYHLFALRGLMQGLHWARGMGFDLLDDPELGKSFRAALLGPTLSALPDFTYPARGDSRYGVSLAQPASLELWEIGRAWLEGDERLDAWLGALYALHPPPPGPGAQYDAWLHDAGLPIPESRAPERSDLSWWALTAIKPAPVTAPAWSSATGLLPTQGLAILRHGDRYASLECGPIVGGHGHPDRLHLSVHAGAVHWLPDQGTGSYVEPSLAWYRSALAHNAPLLDGLNAGGENAWCAAFASEEPGSWCRARAGDITRTVVAAPNHLVDIVEFEAIDERLVELPWHFQGAWRIESAGQWEPADLEHPFVSGAERNVATSQEAPVTVAVRMPGSRASLQAYFFASGAELIRAQAPGLPNTQGPQPFLLLRQRASAIRWVTVLDLTPGSEEHRIVTATVNSDLIEIQTPTARFRYAFAPDGLLIEQGGIRRKLTGPRAAPARRESLFEPRTLPEREGFAPGVAAPPALDGTLDGFDTSKPLLLDSEDQYRRSEEPYDPERFSARAWVNRDDTALYLVVEVMKPEVILRAPDAAPLELDNEPEDINSDGLQLYVGFEAELVGALVIPLPGGGLRSRPIGATVAGSPAIDGKWKRTPEGYTISLGLADLRIGMLGIGARVGFDLLINEMRPGRVRRAGQLVWSGGDGWIYLRGDRQDLPQVGTLELG